MEIIFTNKKYYKDFDGSDNPCCWQVDLVTDDIDEILVDHDVDFDFLSEDWGSAYTWRDKGTEYSLMIICQDTKTATFKILFEAFRKKFLFLSEVVDVTSSPYNWLISIIDNKINQNQSTRPYRKSSKIEQ